MSLVEQKLNILPEHFSSSLDCVCIVLFKLIFCVVFCGSLFVLLYLVIVVSVLLYLVIVVYVTFGLRLLFTHLVSCGHCSVCYLWITASVYPFGIFKRFLMSAVFVESNFKTIWLFYDLYGMLYFSNSLYYKQNCII
jgi:hypothetical protein